MQNVELMYTAILELNGDKKEVRQHQSFETLDQANRRIRRLLERNLEKGAVRYKDFKTYFKNRVGTPIDEKTRH